MFHCVDRYFEFLRTWCDQNNFKYPILIVRIEIEIDMQGLAFNEQIIDDVPCSELDVPLDIIITPSQVFTKSFVC